MLEIAYQEISPALLIFLKQNCSFRSLARVTIIVWLNDFYEMCLFWDSDSFQSYFRIVVFLCETDNHHRHYLPICLPFILKNMQTRKTKTQKKIWALVVFLIITRYYVSYHFCNVWMLKIIRRRVKKTQDWFIFSQKYVNFCIHQHRANHVQVNCHFVNKNSDNTVVSYKF